MKKIFYFLFPLFLISCSPEVDQKPTFNVPSYTAEIGDIITISGTNLMSITNVRIFSPDFSIPAVDILDKPSYTSFTNVFISQTETEIQFVLPELYAENYIMRMGGQDFPLNLKGFFPLANVLDIQSQNVMGLKVINEDKALGRSDNELYLLENGYHTHRLISSNVYSFDVLENGDSWYMKSSDREFYEIYYSYAGTNTYQFFTSFSRSDFDGFRFGSSGILITPQKQVFISTEGGTFIIENNEIKKGLDLFTGLEAYSPEERHIYSFQITPAGTVYGRLNRSGGYLSLDPVNYTFAFSEKFSPVLDGPVFRENTGFLMLPWEQRLFKSSDSGLTWNESPTSTPISIGNMRKSTLKVLDANTALVFLHSSENSNFPYTIAYITRNGGNSWEELKRFDGPRQTGREINHSDFKGKTGLLYFTSGAQKQLWKYVH